MSTAFANALDNRIITRFCDSTLYTSENDNFSSVYYFFYTTSLSSGEVENFQNSHHAEQLQVPELFLHSLTLIFYATITLVLEFSFRHEDENQRGPNVMLILHNKSTEMRLS